MEKEFIKNIQRSVTLNVTAGKIDSFRELERTTGTVRVYEGGCIGVAGCLGEPDEKSLTEKADLTAVGVPGQDQIEPGLGIVPDPLRTMGQEHRAGIGRNELLHLLKRSLFPDADEIDGCTVSHKGHLLVSQNEDAAPGQLRFDLGPVAYPPFMVPLDEIHRPQLGCLLGERVPVFPLFWQVSIQEIPGDGDAIEGKACHGPDHSHAVLTIDAVVKV